jgi:hypothetical protein
MVGLSVEDPIFMKTMIQCQHAMRGGGVVEGGFAACPGGSRQGSHDKVIKEIGSAAQGAEAALPTIEVERGVSVVMDCRVSS